MKCDKVVKRLPFRKKVSGVKETFCDTLIFASMGIPEKKFQRGLKHIQHKRRADGRRCKKKS
jgi:hypothetical protein